MRTFGFGQGPEQALARPVAQANPPPAVAPTTKEIPYDYVARFTLQGNKRGSRVQDVINISIEGGFVASAIGYSFIPPPLPPASAGSSTPTPASGLAAPGTTTTGLSRATAGFDTTSPIDLLLQALINSVGGDPGALAQCLLARLCGISFKYSIVDSGTGRELQNQAIHNIAGLGEASGRRPFRPLAKPMVFMPRSSIRIEVEEISEGQIYQGAELFIVLHGYKLLGYGTALP